jgi:Na+-transporting NADH:ubiquinone oxidoreductase subunit NqrC
MISQLITDQFQTEKLDLITVSTLFFSAFLVLYFFVKIKPALDSRIRINRQVQRLHERDAINEKYQKNKIKNYLGNSVKPRDIDIIYRQQQLRAASNKNKPAKTAYKPKQNKPDSEMLSVYKTEYKKNKDHINKALNITRANNKRLRSKDPTGLAFYTKPGHF